MLIFYNRIKSPALGPKKIAIRFSLDRNFFLFFQLGFR
nr:MAG TPA: hypothetical protein [Caudoviricetes sp.]